jgi:hypothetical protein
MNPGSVTKFVEHAEHFRYFFFSADVYLEIHLLANIRDMTLFVLANKDHDGEKYGFKRNRHREKIEGEGVEWFVAKNTQVCKKPNREERNIYDEKSNRTKLLREKVCKRVGPPALEMHV